ncbi:general odorant-binding protein 45-like [Ochlerotatus camptorhynchus]|uniref:general odorant-binding protein 45-like n=1 Tax=Ochlerotatus camptorhynchus TaxID=644619 RepID=UPI0031CDEC24
MQRFGIFLVLLALTTIAFCDHHKIVLKSLQRASRECTLYGTTDQCLARCTTLITRDWNDTVGILSVYDRFYKPDPSDRCNSNRTQRCLHAQELTATPDRVCLRASEAVQCYLDQFGQVIQDEPKFVRTTALQKQQIIKDCGAMLGHSEERMQELLADSEYLLQETRCLFRCYQIRSGMYNDVQGLNMERFYVACGGYEDDFNQSAAQCIADVRNVVPCDKCTLAQRMTMECIGNRYDQTITNGDSTNRATDNGKIIVINQANQNVDYVNNTLNFG